MFGKFILSVNITDPGADKKVPLLRVPDDEVYTIEDCHIVPDTTLAASTADYYQCSLENGGTAGNGTTVMSGTAGGTAGWTANTPKQAAITEGSGKLTAGQYLNLNYDEAGTIAPGRFTVCLAIVAGKGAKA